MSPTVNNYKIGMFKFVLVFVFLLFLLFPVAFADTIQRNPLGTVSNEDVVTFFVTTDIPTMVIIICNQEPPFSDNLLSNYHNIPTRRFSANSIVDCEVRVMDNASRIIRTYTSSDVPLLKFYVYSKQPFLIIDDAISKDEDDNKIILDRPRGTQKTYTLQIGYFIIENKGLLPMYDISIRGDGSLSNWISFSRTYIPSIGGGSRSGPITVTINIPETAREGTYDSYITITTGNAGTQTIFFRVKVICLVDVEIIQTMSDIKGKLKAGNNYMSSFRIRETIGCKNTGKISMSVDGFPNWITVEGSYDIPNIDAGGETIRTIRITVPERNIIPNTYQGRVIFHYMDKYEIQKIYFEIPRPEMSIDKTETERTYSIDPGNMLKEKIKIYETGGYTPIEGLRISLFNCKRKTKQGEESFDELKEWISFGNVDYIKPGNAGEVSISVRTLGGDRSGEYSCDCKITTKYAGEKTFNIKFILVDPCVIEGQKK